MTYEQFLLTARKLRREAAKAEYEFLSFLVTIEQDERIWKLGQARLCFSEVLNDEDLCRPARYEKFKEACSIFGDDTVRQMGVDAAVEGSRLVSDESRSRFVTAAVEAHTRIGVPWSRQQAVLVRRSLTPPIEIRLSNEVRLTRIQELEAENTRLRRENGELRREVKRLTDLGELPRRSSGRKEKKGQPSLTV